MFKFNIQSSSFAKTMGVLAVAVTSTKKGDNDGVMLTLYKEVPNKPVSIGLLVAFDGKIQISRKMNLADVKSDVNKVEICVDGKRLLSAANAFAQYDTMLTITIDKDMKIEGAGSELSLAFVPMIKTLKKTEELIQEVEVETEKLLPFFQFGASCFSEDRTKVGMDCVAILLNEKDKKMSMYSTNGVRCAYAELPNVTFLMGKDKKKADTKKEEQENSENKGEEEEKPVKPIVTVVEGKVFKSILKNINSKKIRFAVDSKCIWIRSGVDGIMLLTQNIPYPLDMLNDVFGKCVRKGAWKAPIISVYQALAVYEVTKENDYLEMIKAGESQMIFQGTDEHTKASVICAQEGEVDNVGVNGKELKTALGVFEKDRDIIFETSDARLPVLLRQTEDSQNKIFILPVEKDV